MRLCGVGWKHLFLHALASVMGISPPRRAVQGERPPALKYDKACHTGLSMSHRVWVATGWLLETLGAGAMALAVYGLWCLAADWLLQITRS